MAAACQASLSLTISQSLPKFMSIASVMPSSHLILCHPLLLLPSILPAAGYFTVSWLFISGGQSIQASAAASVLPMNIQGWSPLGLTGCISLHSKGLARVFSNTTVQKHQLLGTLFFIVHLSQPYMTTGKTIVLTIWTFVNRIMSLLFNTLSTFVIAFLPRSKHLLISRQQWWWFHHLQWF